jgi:16S rRNA (cytosine1402-N4)-methyltransferase
MKKYDYHNPVLLNESIELLAIKPSGIYVDVTFGGGGHTREILHRLGPDGRLFGFDQDPDAERNVPEDERFTFVQSNFRYLSRYLRLYGVKQIDGVLADLGVSSFQLDEPEKGFSFRFNANLDMRMNPSQEFTAADIVNTWSSDSLQTLFSTLGEVRNAKTLAAAIVSARTQRLIQSVPDFLAIVEPVARGNRNRYLAQVFQALRMQVNEEVQSLAEFLNQSLEVLSPGGRIVVISYHSIEDRMVKHFLKSGNVEGTQEKDFYGKIKRPFRLLTKKALQASEEEIQANPRARSAKLRASEKNNDFE